ncbi:type II secretion system protein [Pseudoalteromonas sp. YIC-656]|uniref:PilW family protein n=1 Tax=Pseudoalteromonas pernae TaxID=3118054 RepID=UPI003242A425
MSARKQLGFTLIELLVAITLITSTIAIVNLVYSNYVRNDIRFAQTADAYSDLLEATDRVRKELKRTGQQEGSVTINNTNCNWSVINEESSKQAAFDFNTGAITQSGASFILSTVELSCENGKKLLPKLSFKVLDVDTGAQQQIIG